LTKALQGKEPPLRVLRAHWFRQIRHLKNSDQSQSPERALIFLMFRLLLKAVGLQKCDEQLTAIHGAQDERNKQIHPISK